MRRDEEVSPAVRNGIRVQSLWLTVADFLVPGRAPATVAEKVLEGLNAGDLRRRPLVKKSLISWHALKIRISIRKANVWRKEVPDADIRRSGNSNRAERKDGGGFGKV